MSANNRMASPQVEKRLTDFVDGILRRADIPPDLAQEAREDFVAHLAADVQRRMAAGILRNEAVDAAIGAFGEEAEVCEALNVVRLEAARAPRDPLIHAKRFRMRNPIDSFRRDVAHGLRALRRRPMSSAAAVTSLAIGIGLNAAVFTVFDWVVLRPLPYPAAHELVRVYTAGTQPMTPAADLNFGEFTAYTNGQVFRAAAAYSTATRVIGGAGVEPAHVEVAHVTGDVAGTLGTGPLLGRALDQRDSDAAVVLLSERLWRSRFGGDPAVVGRIVTIDGAPLTVAGVVPASGGYPAGTDVWRPLTAEQRQDDDREFAMVGRLTSGMTIDAATVQLATIAKAGSNATRTAWAEDLQRVGTRDVQGALVLLLWSSGLILLMTSANVAALVGARGADRAGEMAVRGALGASRLTMLRQLLIEHLVLAILGGTLGLLLGRWLLRALVSAAPAQLPRLSEITLDLRVVLVGSAITAFVGLLVGVLPALKGSRPDLASTLGTAATSRATQRVGGRGTLVAAQVAVAIMLTSGALLFARSLQHMLAIPQGFSPDHLIAVDLYLRGGVAGDARQLFPQLVAAAESVPGVESAAMTMHLPTGVSGLRVPVTMADRPDLAKIPIVVRVVTPRYFETIGAPVKAGRGFAGGDRRGSAPVALVNESFSRELLGGDSPIGLTLTAPVTKGTITIVGIAPDITPGGQADRPAIYLSMDQLAAGSGSLVVRAAGDPKAVIPTLAARLRQVAPTLALDRITPLSEALAHGRAVTRFNALLASSFGALALLLAAVGIYGLTAGAVASRWRDVAIRIALGANVRQAMWSVLKPAAISVAFGLVVGLAGVIGISHSISSLLYGVRPTDPLTLAIVSLALIAVALAAAGSAATRVLLNHPSTTLRA